MKLYLFPIFLASLFIACQSDSKPSANTSSPDIRNMETDVVKEKYDEIMRIHDEVMPEMSTMRRYKKKLLKKGKSDDIMQAVTDLTKADERMMDWMAEFKMPKDVSEKERISYLNKELTSVTAMNQQIKDAMTQAESIINEQ